MTTVISGDTGVSQVQADSIKQDDLASGVVGKGPAFSAATNNNLSVPGTGVITTATNYTSEQFDTSGSFDPVTGKFQPSIAGYYLLSVSAQFAVSARNASFIAVTIIKNGAGEATAALSSNGGFPTINCVVLTYLNGTTDYVTVGLVQNSGSTWNDVGIQRFSGCLVRAA